MYPIDKDPPKLVLMSVHDYKQNQSHIVSHSHHHIHKQTIDFIVAKMIDFIIIYYYQSLFMGFSLTICLLLHLEVKGNMHLYEYDYVDNRHAR